MKQAGYSVGQRCIIATGFKPLVGDIVVKKRIDTITKMSRKGFEIGKLKFDFNGQQKQKQQISPNSMLSVALPISYKEAIQFKQNRMAKINEKKSLVKELKKVNKELDAIEKQIERIESTPLNKLRKQTKF